LPSSLLITRRWRNRITPVYAKLSQENLGVARLLIQTYRDFVGRKKGELGETVEGLEALDYDYRYIRGLSALLDRRCQFESKTAINPIKIRRRVFKIAHEKPLPTTPEAREAVLHQAASELKVAVEELEEALYGDLEEEFILKGFKPVDPIAGVRQYNLSLTQTLLFYSTELTFNTQGNWQRIFRQIKWLGLIYTIWRSSSGYQVKVDGPTSLFKLNRRYGTSLAKLLPTIIQSSRWSINAKILRRKEKRRLLNLELDSQKHGVYLQALKKLEEKKYDSQVEQDFARRFTALDTGWILTREPEPIPVGRQVMIPDFSFQKAGLRVYMEVVGFWTPQYLKEKIKKLIQLGDVDMIVAADRDLACQKLDRIGKRLNVLYYQRRIPLQPVLAYLKAKEKCLVKAQVKRLNAKTLTIKKPVVEAWELAKTMGVLEDAIKEVFVIKKIPGYTRLGDMLIRKTKLQEIHERLEERLDQGELSLGEASKIIEDTGARRPTSILDVLGYRIEWHGIDPQSAKIHRKTRAELN
jgi:predicted nuclease of restriction endonuclease-like RecB superfamily